MSLNENLRRARREKNDEFYTQLPDIEKELRHYTRHFRGEVVYCNCDDPRVSNFFHYFSYNFKRLGLKRLVTTCYRNRDRDLFTRHDSDRAICCSEPFGFLKLNTDAGRRHTFKLHRLGNEAPDPLRRFDQVLIGKVDVARRRAVSGVRTTRRAPLAIPGDDDAAAPPLDARPASRQHSASGGRFSADAMALRALGPPRCRPVSICDK